jgi:tetratricopeptide (TPR) repeat protein
MKNRIKSYWSNCLSITAIICSVVAICVSLPSTPELGIDYIGVIVGILSFLVTLLIGWQIYNAVTIEKKVKEKIQQASNEFNKSIEKTREDLSISGTKSMMATLYKTENVFLNVCILAGDYQKAINTLRVMLEYAIALNEHDRICDVAKIIVSSKYKICNRILNFEDHEIIYNSFLELSQIGLSHLVASDDQARQLYVMAEEIRCDLIELKKRSQQQ